MRYAYCARHLLHPIQRIVGDECLMNQHPSEIEPPQLPRWVQVFAGCLLAPIVLLCVAGAASMFTIPKVQGSPPLLLLAAAIVLGTLWCFVMCVRMIFGIRRHYGLFGTWSLRIIAIGALGIVVSGLFTGFYVRNPVVGVVMAISYILAARRLWLLARSRSMETQHATME